LTALAVFALGIAVWAAGQALDLDGLRIAAKPVPLLALCAWARHGDRRILAGLVFSAAGDLVMELGRATGFFLAGMGAFALAHVAYLAGFLRRSREPGLLGLIPFVAWGALLMGRLWPQLGALRLPVAVYAALLLAMMWRALVASRAVGRWDAAAGALLFGLSDSLIALDRFGPPFPGARWLVMATYWAGQLGIARFARPA
jgi:uncharacterized membrane protein YhhN